MIGYLVLVIVYWLLLIGCWIVVGSMLCVIVYVVVGLLVYRFYWCIVLCVYDLCIIG